MDLADQSPLTIKLQIAPQPAPQLDIHISRSTRGTKTTGPHRIYHLQRPTDHRTPLLTKQAHLNYSFKPRSLRLMILSVINKLKFWRNGK